MVLIGCQPAGRLVEGVCVCVSVLGRGGCMVDISGGCLEGGRLETF